jgi:uncharacterized protein
MRDRQLSTAAIAIMVAALAGAAPAHAQGPMPITPGAPAAKPTPPPHATTAPKRVKPSTVRPSAADAPAPAAMTAPQSAENGPGDLAYGAYQRGYYLTAFQEATKRVNDKGDPKAMTLLAELYANGFGVPNNDDEAAKWFKLAAERGDREAMFELAMFRLGGRGGSRDSTEATRLLAEAAKLGQPAAAYNLGLLYLEGRQFPQDLKRAAELFQVAAQAGTPEAQYALATLYKDGRGVPQDIAQATRLMGEAAKADFLDAEVEYAIALFNGTGTTKDDARAAALFRKAAMQGSPIAQNRLARIYRYGRGVPNPDPVQAIRWHLVSKAAGASDLDLDDYMQKQSPEVRAAAEQAAKPWLDILAASRARP